MYAIRSYYAIEEQRPAKEKFDYMTLLENKEVKVDLPEPKAEDPAKPAPQYQMQCGSFRSADQANEMKVKIALAAGISAQVKRTDGKNGTWYRVVLGPYKGRRAAQTDVITSYSIHYTKLYEPRRGLGGVLSLGFRQVHLDLLVLQ